MSYTLDNPSTYLHIRYYVTSQKTSRVLKPNLTKLPSSSLIKIINLDLLLLVLAILRLAANAWRILIANLDVVYNIKHCTHSGTTRLVREVSWFSSLSNLLYPLCQNSSSKSSIIHSSHGHCIALQSSYCTIELH